jgi:hypothetical protein
MRNLSFCPMFRTLVLSVLFVAGFGVLATPGLAQTAQDCSCQGGQNITETIQICVNGVNYSATVTRCESRGSTLYDPCSSGYKPDVVTMFKKICTYSGTYDR